MDVLTDGHPVICTHLCPLSGAIFACVVYHFSFMKIVSPDTVNYAGTNAGANQSITTEQIIRYAGYAVGATAVVGSVGVVAAVAPAQIALASGMTAGCLYVADCMENDRDIIPSWPLSMNKPVDVKPVVSVTAPSVAEPAAA